jgi:[acyl-carrier-protein] S-malonyltransferase
MSRRVVLLFSGQGAQRVGMGRDLADEFPAARELFAEADEILGLDLGAVMSAGPIETLTRTRYCQPALFVHGLACLRILQSHVPGLNVIGCAGLSLGELTAHAAAGTFSFADGLRLVAARGRFMDEACAETEGAMAAMIGGDEDAVRELAAECGVDIANFNAPGQIVLSGPHAGIALALERARGRGIRLAKLLQVAGAYHSRLMQSAQDKFRVELARVRLETPRLPVISNFTARTTGEAGEIRRTLESQITGAVRWSESMKLALEWRPDLFIELGPSAVLSGLMGRIDKSARVLRVEDVTSEKEAVAALTAHDS